MTVVNTEIDLEKIFIDFGPENGEKIYYGEGLSHYDNRDLINLLGHNVKKSTVAGGYIKRIKKGRFRASEVREMCINLGKDPKEILSKYSSETFRYVIGVLLGEKGGTFMEKLDKETEEVVWDAICDGL